jgi:hypothetical protein
LKAYTSQQETLYAVPVRMVECLAQIYVGF